MWRALKAVTAYEASSDFKTDASYLTSMPADDLSTVGILTAKVLTNGVSLLLDNFNFEYIVNSDLFIDTFCYNEEINVAQLYATLPLWGTSGLTRLHFPIDASYGASWNDSWGGSNYAREPTFRTEYQDRIPNFHNYVFAPPIKCDVMKEVISRLNNENNFQWRLWQDAAEAAFCNAVLAQKYVTLHPNKDYYTNLSHDHIQAIKSLTVNSDVLVMPADKDAKTVIWSKSYDLAEGIRQLKSDTITYSDHDNIVREVRMVIIQTFTDYNTVKKLIV
ncbi:hypothetical protein GJ496_002570 [Pomphorhynchus laevis]|nr:hypothetical protein GJ496_002570 [Pomphorhynchus laevis]